MMKPAHSNIARWAGAFALALGGHVAVLAAVGSVSGTASSGADVPVITLEFAPLVEAPNESTHDVVPQEVEQAAVPPEPETPEPPTTETTAPPPEPAVEAVATIPPPETVQPPKPEPQPQHKPEARHEQKPKPKPRPQIALAAAAPRDTPAERVAAPILGQGETARRIASWQSQVAAHLNRLKRFPEAAQSRGDAGTVTVVFSIDRSGKVLSAALGKSSGSSALDQEGTALAHRASPVPAPPPEVTGNQIRLSVPIRFVAR